MIETGKITDLMPLANFKKKYTRSGSRIMEQLHYASN